MTAKRGDHDMPVPTKFTIAAITAMALASWQPIVFGAPGSSAINMTYSVERKRNGQVSHVSAKEPFQRGDGVRLHLQTNTNAYVYILALRAGSGQYDMLNADAESGFQVKEGKDYVLPPKPVSLNGPASLKVIVSKTRLKSSPAALLKKLQPGHVDEGHRAFEPAFMNEPSQTIVSDDESALLVDLDLKSK